MVTYQHGQTLPERMVCYERQLPSLVSRPQYLLNVCNFNYCKSADWVTVGLHWGDKYILEFTNKHS